MFKQRNYKNLLAELSMPRHCQRFKFTHLHLKSFQDLCCLQSEVQSVQSPACSDSASFSISSLTTQHLALCVPIMPSDWLFPRKALPGLCTFLHAIVCLDFWYSKCGPWTSYFSITWERSKIRLSGLTLDLLNPNPHFHKTLRWFLHIKSLEYSETLLNIIDRFWDFKQSHV